MDYNGITCPHCKTGDMAPVLYGFPTPDMIDLARQDIIALGGCTVDINNPTHYCYSCNETATIG